MKSRKRPVHSWKPASPSLLIHSPASSRPVDMTSHAKTTATALPNLNNSCWFSSQGQIKGSTFPALSNLGWLLPGFLLYPCSSIPEVQPKKLHKDTGHTRRRTATGAHLLQKKRRFPKPPWSVSRQIRSPWAQGFCLLPSPRRMPWVWPLAQGQDNPFAEVSDLHHLALPFWAMPPLPSLQQSHSTSCPPHLTS